jgi:ABC-type glycerol-3-phosphate transport system permease component
MTFALAPSLYPPATDPTELPDLPGPARPALPPEPDAAEEPALTGRSRVRTMLGHVTLAALSLFCVFPVYWMYASALRRPGDVLNQALVPWPLSVGSFQSAFDALPIGSLVLNTLLVALFTATGQLLVCLFAGYAFAAWKFRGQSLLFLLFVGTWLVPFQVTMIPNYVLLNQLGLLNTLAGVVVPTLCSSFAVILLRQHMQAFPRELLDAARMDGRSSWGTLWTVVVPNLRAALASLAILLFISAWNEYFWPALVLQRANSVLQLGIRGFVTSDSNNWGALMAASGLACLPIFAIYLLLRRHVVDAFIRSGLR